MSLTVAENSLAVGVRGISGVLDDTTGSSAVVTGESLSESLTGYSRVKQQSAAWVNHREVLRVNLRYTQQSGLRVTDRPTLQTSPQQLLPHLHVLPESLKFNNVQVIRHA